MVHPGVFPVAPLRDVDERGPDQVREGVEVRMQRYGDVSALSDLAVVAVAVDCLAWGECGAGCGGEEGGPEVGYARR